MEKVGDIIWFGFSLIKLNTSHSPSRETLTSLGSDINCDSGAGTSPLCSQFIYFK